MKRILLITHDASRTGAPMVVLHFARWLREHRPAVAVDVLAVKGGELAAEFRSAADTYWELNVAPPQRGLAVRAIRKGMRMVGLLRAPSAAEVRDRILQEIAAHNYDAVLANSLASIPLAVQLKA
jgi:hypothetical protein